MPNCSASEAIRWASEPEVCRRAAAISHTSGPPASAARRPVGPGLKMMPGWAMAARPSRTKRSMSSVSVVPSLAAAAARCSRSSSSRRTLVVVLAMVPPDGRNTMQCTILRRICWRRAGSLTRARERVRTLLIKCSIFWYNGAMDYVQPIEAVVPGAQGRVLGVLARSEMELTMRAVARLAGTSVGQTSLVVGRLVELGLVTRRDIGPASLVRLDRRNEAARAFVAL